MIWTACGAEAEEEAEVEARDCGVSASAARTTRPNAATAKASMQAAGILHVRAARWWVQVKLRRVRRPLDPGNA